MKRLLPVLLLVAAFALGAGVAKLTRYSYVSDDLNQSCGKTVFEWQVMANRIDTTPVPLNANWDIIKLEGEPKKEGLIVRAYLRPRDPKTVMPDSLHWQQFVSTLASAVRTQANKRFTDTDPNKDGVQENLSAMVYIGDRLVAVYHQGAQAVLKPDATRGEQLAAMAQVFAPSAAARP